MGSAAKEVPWGRAGNIDRLDGRTGWRFGWMDVVRLKCGRVGYYVRTVSYHVETTLERHYYHPPHAQSAMCEEGAIRQMGR